MIKIFAAILILFMAGSLPLRAQEDNLDILNSLLDILHWTESPGQKGLLLKLCTEIHLRWTY